MRIAVGRDEEEGRDGLYAKNLGQFFFFVYVDLVDVYLAGIFVRECLEAGRQLTAGTAPFCVKVNYCGFVTQKFPTAGVVYIVSDLFQKLFFIQMYCCHSDSIFIVMITICFGLHCKSTGFWIDQQQIYTIFA
ncbi:membrane protein [gut metagenome]|uniref:Membrane protein n=1 Tax=gut metagenome TaxID=749906 RepID=J9H507_9ZZZZ